ncbi:elongation of fatty acids protein 3-like [Durio zibethinus]|uniref:Elongation of fatty acids protein 3-like n=1 Tax=Durio zibethinus TaxID=66656 RepID=A0A6P6B4V1_DURZI|nr:elongation of fatty acids protein 3-like [Durio zibethinus]
MMQSVKYWLSEHPSIVNFRWSQSFGSTWSFLFSAIAVYVVTAITLHVFLSLILPKRRRVPLGPIPAIHSLCISLISVVIFVGILLSAATEIRYTRWFWRRTKTITTPFQWFLCFPLGTRPSGRVFFWSYVFYLARFLHLFRTFFTILRHRKLTFFHLFNQSILLCMSFLWLEFSQSFQVLAILLATLLYSVVYGYRFWTAIGLPTACFPFVVNCQVVLLGCNLVCHFGVLSLHFLKGGCNGMGAWGFNSVLNGVILGLFLNFYVKRHLRKRNADDISGHGGSSSSSARSCSSSASEIKGE